MQRALVACALIACSAIANSQEASPAAIRFRQCRPGNVQDCLNGVTTSVTSSDAIRIIGNRTARLARRAAQDEPEFAAFWDGRSGGFAAGDTLGGWELWTNYTHTDQSSDFVNPDLESLVFGYEIEAGTVGLQRLLADRWLLGGAIGYESGDIETEFNGGGADSDGVLFTPYVAYLINDHLSIDASFGYTTLDYDQERIAPDNGSSIIAGFDAERWFVNANLAAFTTYAEWAVGAHVGYLYVAEDQDGYVEITAPNNPASTRAKTVGQREVTLSQFTAGADVAYPFEYLEPYAYVAYRNDLSRDEGRAAGGLPNAQGAVLPGDDDEFELGAGLRLDGEGALSGGVEFNYIAGREDFEAWNLSATLRYGF